MTSQDSQTPRTRPIPSSTEVRILAAEASSEAAKLDPSTPAWHAAMTRVLELERLALDLAAMESRAPTSPEAAR